MKIGILALQGAFAEHAKVLDRLGVESVEIRNLDDFQKHQSDLSGLILPGGESTTCLLYTSPSPRDATLSRMPSSA